MDPMPVQGNDEQYALCDCISAVHKCVHGWHMLTSQSRFLRPLQQCYYWLIMCIAAISVCVLTTGACHCIAAVLRFFAGNDVLPEASDLTK